MEWDRRRNFVITMSARHALRIHPCVVGAVLLLVAAWCSVGYHGEDEHHQTIGLALARQGVLPVEEIVWEYEARIRSSTLPWIVIGVEHITQLIGVHDPFLNTTILRLLTAVLACVVTVSFLRATDHLVPADLRRAYRWITWCLWFLPFIHVRFASETWSGLMLLLGASWLIRSDPQRAHFVWAGMCLAIAAWVRPPVALATMGLLAWTWQVQRTRWRSLAPLIIAFALTTALAVLADSLFYGLPTMSSIRFVRMGLLGDPDHAFGELAWWYYFPWLVKYTLPPIGLFTLVAFLVVLWRDRSHPALWVIIPFLFLHMAVPHKEPRFLWPLAAWVPLLWIAAWPWMVGSVTGSKWPERIAIGAYVLVTIPALAVAVLTPAGNGRIAIASALDHAGHGRDPIGYLTHEEPWRITIPRYYRPDAPAPITSTAPDDLAHVPWWILHPGSDPLPNGLLRMKSGLPEWSIPLMDIYHWGKWSGPVVLYERR